MIFLDAEKYWSQLWWWWMERVSQKHSSSFLLCSNHIISCVRFKACSSSPSGQLKKYFLIKFLIQNLENMIKYFLVNIFISLIKAVFIPWNQSCMSSQVSCFTTSWQLLENLNQFLRPTLASPPPSSGPALAPGAGPGYRACAVTPLLWTGRRVCADNLRKFFSAIFSQDNVIIPHNLSPMVIQLH